MASYEKTSATRTFIAQLFSAVALDNFGASFSSALSDDLTWTVTGSSPIAGVYHPKSEYISQVGLPCAWALIKVEMRLWSGVSECLLIRSRSLCRCEQSSKVSPFQ